MKSYTPERPLERFALLVVAAVASLSLMSGVVLVLNHEEQGAVTYAKTACVPAEASTTSANAATAGCSP